MADTTATNPVDVVGKLRIYVRTQKGLILAAEIVSLPFLAHSQLPPNNVFRSLPIVKISTSLDVVFFYNSGCR